MPTLFSKLSNRTSNKHSASRFGPAVSSTDLVLFPSPSPSSHDAREIEEVIEPESNRSGRSKAPKTEDKELRILERPDGQILTERSTNLSKGSNHERGWQASGQSAVSEFGLRQSAPTHPASSLDRPLQQSSTSQSLSPPPARMYKTLPTKPTLPSKSPANVYKTTTSDKKLIDSITYPTLSGSVADSVSALDQGGEIQPPMYGYSPIGWDKQLDLPKVAELVMMCGEQIRARGLTMPLIFSSMALDLSSNNVTSLIRTYLTTPKEFYGSETKFANPHDLAAIVKWSLSRLGRVFPVPIPSLDHGSLRKGEAQEDNVLIRQRGFLELENYSAWASLERSSFYPVAAFSTFLDGLPSSAAALLVALFSLLSSTTSYSIRNGMTPSRLARLFGILVFGVPEDESFERTYDAYVKASNATEHLLLAYIRDMSTMEPLPTRLADHVRGYPQMLAPDPSKPGKGVRGTPFTMISRAVRLYSVDLIHQASDLDVGELSPEWSACCGKAEGSDKKPLLSDRYKKLINLRASKRANITKAGQDVMDSKLPRHAELSKIYEARIHPETEAYASLADKAWDEFISDGFAAPDSTKLAFDLRESARRDRLRGRKSVAWNQFEECGFSQKDDGLASVLAFDDLIEEDVKKWPEERAELIEKIRKTNKAMPPFSYDTAPYVVSGPSSSDDERRGQWREKPYSRMDDVFPEVYADVLLGNGWSNRDELTHRNANFVVVQFKSRPLPSTGDARNVHALNASQKRVQDIDDRTDASWFVIEEVVPLQYRSELEAIGRKKTRSRASLRNLSLFKRRKDNIGGHAADTSFLDDILRPGVSGSAKKLTLRDATSIAPGDNIEGSFNRRSNSTSSPDEVGSNPTNGSSSVRLLATLKSRASKRLRTKGILSTPVEEDDSSTPPPPPPKERSVTQSGSWDSVDFETRSLHDPEMEAFATSDRRKGGSLLKSAMSKTEKRLSKDDAWLDIMVRANDLRISAQDSDPSASTKLKSRVPQQWGHDRLEEPSRATAKASPGSRSAKVDLSPAEQAGEGQASSSRAIKASGWSREDISPSTQKAPSADRTTGAERRDGILNTLGNDQGNEEDVTNSPGDLDANTESAAETPTENADGDDRSSSASTLRHLRSLPPRQPCSEADREKAREERIEAAKDRARQLRANLNPVSVDELERKRQERLRNPRDANSVASSSTSASLRQNLTPTKLTKAAALGTSPTVDLSLERSSPTGSAPSPSWRAKDDPFAKDRFSGRVASLTNKFSGQTHKPLTPQHSGNVHGEQGELSISGSKRGDGQMESTDSSADADILSSTSESAKQELGTSLGSKHRVHQTIGGDRVDDGARATSLSLSTRDVSLDEVKDRGTGSQSNSQKEVISEVKQIANSEAFSHFPASSLPPDSNELASHHSLDSSAAIGFDSDTIYPDDAASNFSRDTNPDEDTAAHPHQLRLPNRSEPVSSVAHSSSSSSSSSPSLFAKLQEPPAMAGAAAAAAIATTKSPPERAPDISTTVSILTSEQLRAEAEDLAMGMPPGFGQRYQPGMPLSNVEEERESVLSGSNV